MKVIYHCSESPYGNAAMITKWHLQRGWRTIGYHYVILNGWLDSGMYNRAFDGHLETGRPLDDNGIIEPDEAGAHTRGWNDCIGVCLIGMSGQFSDKQISTARRVNNLLIGQFQEIEIGQHSDYDPRKPHCAGLDLSVFY